MGTFSKVHRFHGAGENPNVNNVAVYGQPVRSLYTSTKVFTIHHHIDITDDSQNIVYQANTKVFTIHDKTDVTDASGRQVAHIERKLLSFHERHYIDMADGVSFELSNEIFHIIKDITNIEGLSWQLRGNILGLNFELFDQYGNIVAVIGQKMLSIHDKYCIDIYQADKEQIVVAIVVALQHMIRDREAASSSSSSSSN
ncbi:MAG: LURP-one-related family protein [Clostridiales bacterium]|nr:LURP-one-related family protein [Clostridiales bacterium]